MLHDLQKLLTNKVDRYGILASFTLLVSSALAFTYLRGHDINYDLRNYHFYSGYGLLFWRFDKDIAAAGVQTFFNPLASALAYIAISNLPFPFYKWTFLLIQLLSLAACLNLINVLARLSKISIQPRHKILVLFLSFLSPVWWSELGTTFSSSWTAPLIIFAISLLFQGRYLFSGFLLGLSCGIKLTNAPFAIAGLVVPATLLATQGSIDFVRANVRYVIGGIVGFMLTAWWNMYLYVHWGSPIFPFFNKIFGSPFFSKTNLFDERWYFSSVGDVVDFVFNSFLGTKKTLELEFADARYFIMLLLFVFWFFSNAKKMPSVLKSFCLYSLVVFVIWAVLFAYHRYIVALELLFGIIIWISVSSMLSEQRRITGAMLLFVVTCLATIKIPNWGGANATFGEMSPLARGLNSDRVLQPAHVVILGQPITGYPISYLLPSFHKDGIFYGTGVFDKIDDLIFIRAFSNHDDLVYFLAREDDLQIHAAKVHSMLERHRVRFETCAPFSSAFERYLLCELKTDRSGGHI